MHRSITKRRFSSTPQSREEDSRTLIKASSQGFTIHTAGLLNAGVLVG